MLDHLHKMGITVNTFPILQVMLCAIETSTGGHSIGVKQLQMSIS